MSPRKGRNLTGNQLELLKAYAEDGLWATITELVMAQKVPADRSYAGLLRTAEALVNRGYLAEGEGTYQITAAGIQAVQALN